MRADRSGLRAKVLNAVIGLLFVVAALGSMAMLFGLWAVVASEGSNPGEKPGNPWPIIARSALIVIAFGGAGWWLNRRTPKRNSQDLWIGFFR